MVMYDLLLLPIWSLKWKWVYNWELIQPIIYYVGYSSQNSLGIPNSVPIHQKNIGTFYVVLTEFSIKIYKKDWCMDQNRRIYRYYALVIKTKCEISY